MPVAHRKELQGHSIREADDAWLMIQRRGIFNLGAIRSEVERRSDGLCASHTPVVFGGPLSTDVDPLLAIYDASVETVSG